MQVILIIDHRTRRNFDAIRKRKRMGIVWASPAYTPDAVMGSV